MHVDKNWEKEMADTLHRRRLHLFTNVGPRQNFSQTAVARKIGITAACLNRWENGNSSPKSWNYWKKWTDALNMDFYLEAVPKEGEISISKIIQRCFEKAV